MREPRRETLDLDASFHYVVHATWADQMLSIIEKSLDTGQESINLKIALSSSWVCLQSVSELILGGKYQLARSLFG